MLTRLADLGIRAPRRVLGLAGLLFVLATLYGTGAASVLTSGGFAAPDAPSTRVVDTLRDTFHTGEANLVLEVTAPDGQRADGATTRAVGVDVARRLSGGRYVSDVTSYWGAPPAQAGNLLSRDGRSALVLARVAGDDTSAPTRTADITTRLVGDHHGVRVIGGGPGNTFAQINEQTRGDLATAEMIAIPITTVALIWVFGSLIAALLPLAVGLSAIVGTMALLRGLASLTDVSIFALNMTTAMGLALAIDYSLFVVNRYREEVTAGVSRDDAIRRTMQTAGRTVLFSAMTVGLSLSALLVFPMYFLRSFAYAGVAVVGLATVSTLVLLPALLAVLGDRVDSLDLRGGLRRVLRRPEPLVKPVQETFWYRVATAVMRRGMPVALLVTTVLLALAVPFLHASFGSGDDRVIPASNSARQVGDDLRTRFTADASSDVIVVAPDVSGDPQAIGDYAARLSRVDGVTAVSSAAGTFVRGSAVASGTARMRVADATYLTVRTSADVHSDRAATLLSAVDAVHAPWAVRVGGPAAVNRDSLDALGAALPWAVVLIALTTLIVLFLFTGSVVLPIKALVLNVLSLSATFGAMVWIFQDGHLGGLFPDLTTTGYLVPTMPPLMFCIAFGLSMDYEIFLLSRIREAWLESGRTTADNTQAVALGLGRTGRIVTAAALLMSIVFAAMAGSSVSFMMLFGAGLTLAVVMDATVVRGVLVPAFMGLAGRWNWWAPRPLVRLHDRIGLHEGPSEIETREPVTV